MKLTCSFLVLHKLCDEVFMIGQNQIGWQLSLSNFAVANLVMDVFVFEISVHRSCSECGLKRSAFWDANTG